MATVATALERLLKADGQMTIRQSWGTAKLSEAVDQLNAYLQFQPEHFDRRAVNTRYVRWCSQKERRDEIRHSGRDHHDEGQTETRDIACVERADLTPTTLGLTLAEGKAILKAYQRWCGAADDGVC